LSSGTVDGMVVRWLCACVVLLGSSTAVARSAAPSASRAADSRRRSKAAPCQPAAVSLSRDTSFLRSAVAGGAAACVATVTFHPVDTVKTMLQQQGASGLAGLRRSGQLSARVLYRGVGPAAFSMMPACAARMASYEALKAALLRAAPTLPQGPLVVLASALSVVASGVVRSPLDMVKVQLQAGAAPSAAAAVQEALRGGVRGVYRGMGLALLRDVPFFSINLVLYETLKAQALLRKRDATGDTEARLEPAEVLLLGAVAQGVAGLSTNPLDALKTRVQAGGAADVGEAMRGILAADGVAGLMRGASMRVLWIAPQGCVYYPVYEAVQSCRPRQLRRDLRLRLDRQVARLPPALQAATPWQAGV